MTTRPTVGVLDLQGGVQEHLEHFRRLGVDAAPVKEAGELPGLAGLVIPGGESTCLARLLRIFGLWQPLIDAHRSGTRFWGTCAGAILLATEVADGTPALGLLDITVERNAFGGQLQSFRCERLVPAVADKPQPLTFIRAPKISRLGPGVRSLLDMDGYSAVAEDDRCLATVFHPELTAGLAFHRYFASRCGLSPRTDVPDLDAGWSLQSWMDVSRHG